MGLREKIENEMLIEAKTKTKLVIERIFRVKENKGDLPYILMWIGKNKLLSINHFTQLENAVRAKDSLEIFGIKSSLLIDYNHCKMANKEEKLLMKTTGEMSVDSISETS